MLGAFYLFTNLQIVRNLYRCFSRHESKDGQHAGDSGGSSTRKLAPENVSSVDGSTQRADQKRARPGFAGKDLLVLLIFRCILLSHLQLKALQRTQNFPEWEVDRLIAEIQASHATEYVRQIRGTCVF